MPEYTYPTSGVAGMQSPNEVMAGIESTDLKEEKLNFLLDTFPKLNDLDDEMKVYSGAAPDLIMTVADNSNADVLIVAIIHLFKRSAWR